VGQQSHGSHGAYSVRQNGFLLQGWNRQAVVSGRVLGEVKMVKGAGLTWAAAFADADREAALGLSPAGSCS
jgi:hypothetical protein